MYNPSYLFTISSFCFIPVFYYPAPISKGTTTSSPSYSDTTTSASPIYKGTATLSSISSDTTTFSSPSSSSRSSYTTSDLSFNYTTTSSPDVQPQSTENTLCSGLECGMKHLPLKCQVVMSVVCTEKVLYHHFIIVMKKSNLQWRFWSHVYAYSKLFLNITEYWYKWSIQGVQKVFDHFLKLHICKYLIRHSKIGNIFRNRIILTPNKAYYSNLCILYININRKIFC